MILILGIGNEILTDDGIGPKLVKDLSKGMLNPGVQWTTACVGGLEIIELIAGYDQVILIDAIKTRGGIPGSVYLFSPHDFRETLHLSNLHDISFLTALKLGEQLGFSLPSDIQIIAIEIIEDEVFSDEFTPPLKKRYPMILKEIKSYLSDQKIVMQTHPMIK